MINTLPAGNISRSIADKFSGLPVCKKFLYLYRTLHKWNPRAF